METWDLWFPGPGSTGLPFARSRINGADAADRILVHAAPQRLQVTVRDDTGPSSPGATGCSATSPDP